jgi:6-pyruvoyltetrahydropterin/6-carboxytetrahydropterin synthase
MSSSAVSIFIKKSNLKFSSAHMTVWTSTQKEGLHGHNYTTEARFVLREYQVDQSLQGFVPYSDLKAVMQQICEAWDEKVLLPQLCPYFKIIEQTAQSIEFKLCGSRYVLPASEVVLLAVDNITTEALAFEFGQQLAAGMTAQLREKIIELTVCIEESPGQGASYTLRTTQGMLK